VGNVLLARLGFLILAVPVVALLMIVPEKALSNDLWYVIAAVSGLGALTTHGWLSHASTAGLLAQGAHVVHFAAVSVWLGGLVIVAVVILPRRRAEELGDLVPRFSRLAFGSVVTALLVGGALLILISPRWTALPASDYGRLLLVKILLVAALIAAASRARRSVARHWLIRTAPAGPPRREVAPPMGPPLATEVATLAAADEYSVGEQALRPMVNAVLAELCIAASILAATALLLGRAPPT
jgi:copper transport protein